MDKVRPWRKSFSGAMAKVFSGAARRRVLVPSCWDSSSALARLRTTRASGDWPPQHHFKPSVSVTLSQDFKKSLEKYVYVEPQAPIIDIPQIELHALRDVLDCWCRTSRTIALSPPGYARLDV